MQKHKQEMLDVLSKIGKAYGQEHVDLLLANGCDDPTKFEAPALETSLRHVWESRAQGGPCIKMGHIKRIVAGLDRIMTAARASAAHAPADDTGGGGEPSESEARAMKERKHKMLSVLSKVDKSYGQEHVDLLLANGCDDPKKFEAPALQARLHDVWESRAQGGPCIKVGHIKRIVAGLDRIMTAAPAPAADGGLADDVVSDEGEDHAPPPRPPRPPPRPPPALPLAPAPRPR